VAFRPLSACLNLIRVECPLSILRPENTRPPSFRLERFHPLMPPRILQRHMSFSRSQPDVPAPDSRARHSAIPPFTRVPRVSRIWGSGIAQTPLNLAGRPPPTLSAKLHALADTSQAHHSTSRPAPRSPGCFQSAESAPPIYASAAGNQDPAITVAYAAVAAGRRHRSAGRAKAGQLKSLIQRFGQNLDSCVLKVYPLGRMRFRSTISSCLALNNANVSTSF
jgi:hypothetical protein